MQSGSETIRRRFLAERTRRDFMSEVQRADHVNGGTMPRVQSDIRHIFEPYIAASAAGVWLTTAESKAEMLLSNGVNVRLVMDTYEERHAPRKCARLGCTRPQMVDGRGRLMFNGDCSRHRIMHPRFLPEAHRMPDKLRLEYNRYAVLHGQSERDVMRGKKPLFTAWEATERAEQIVSHWLASIGYDEDGNQRRKRGTK